MRITRTTDQTFELEFSSDELKQLKEIEDVFGYSPQEIIAKALEKTFEHATQSLYILMEDIRKSGEMPDGNQNENAAKNGKERNE